MCENTPFQELKDFLDEQVEIYNTPDFIVNDPISIPHAFTLKQDVEIIGFFAAILAWGQRKTIINKCFELSDRMGGHPYDFIKNHSQEDLKLLEGFKHRTFNDTDLLYLIDFLQRHYQSFDGLEDAFLNDGKFISIEDSLRNFHEKVFSAEYAPGRTQKHIATPAKKSTCKRLNMYLRWMVRKDDCGVDFGIWNRIPQSKLICPIDVHVHRTSRELALIERPQTDWITALELTDNLRQLDSDDPVKYDFALFVFLVNRK